MKLSIGLPPGPQAVEVAKAAEELGHDRFWLFDSAALYEDVWITLAECARATRPLAFAELQPSSSTRPPVRLAAAR